MLINKRIEIVASTEVGLSSMSQESREAVRAVLSKHFTDVRVAIVNTLADLEALVARRPDLVFLGMKFVPEHPGLGWQDPDKIWLADCLDSYGITYTGSGSRAHELELNKPLAKQRVLESGYDTSLFFVAMQNIEFKAGDNPLGYPVFIKPTNRGGGLGIDSDSVAHDFESMRAKVRSIADNHQSDSLIESYLSGREFSVAILKDELSENYSVMPIELVAPPDQNGVSILSGEVKSSNTEHVAELTDAVVRASVTELAINVFHALGARDYGRIDIRLNAHGDPQFLEANLLPSLISGYGSFPKACMLNRQLDYEPMLLSIVGLALERSVIEDNSRDEQLGYNVLPVPLGI